MRVFISYSRSDEALAHLLAFILTNGGINCLIDRYLPTARAFDDKLKEMIDSADVILVLLTQASLSSPWVNQEIGYATAQNKLIWPLAMENDLKPDGMIAATQAYSLFDWTDPHRTIERLLKALQGELCGTNNHRFQEIGLDHVLDGKEARTDFLVERLQDLSRQRGQTFKIYGQAAFSIFAASDDPLYREAGNHTEEYMKLLLAERKAFGKLVASEHTEVKLILWPVRAYDPKYLQVRFENLLKWLDEIKNDASVDVACAAYPKPKNRLIVAGEFVLEGYKLNKRSGYEMSVVRYQPTKIDTAVRDFETYWRRLSKSKAQTIEQIQKMYQQLIDK